MSSIPTKQIDGDVAVGRNVSAGGNAVVRGCATIGHNLKVEGWLHAPNIKGACKGYFLSLTDLNDAYPAPADGDYAFVSESGLPGPIYIAKNGVWTDSGKTGGPTLDVNDIDDLRKEVAEYSGSIDAIDKAQETLRADFDTHVQNASKEIAAVKATADTAAAEVAIAKEQAAAAVSTANEANTTANEAKNAAQSANDKANAAKSEAETANTTASAAAKSAAAAAETAAGAVTAINTLKTENTTDHAAIRKEAMDALAAHAAANDKAFADEASARKAVSDALAAHETADAADHAAIRKTLSDSLASAKQEQHNTLGISGIVAFDGFVGDVTDDTSTAAPIVRDPNGNVQQGAATVHFSTADGNFLIKQDGSYYPIWDDDYLWQDRNQKPWSDKAYYNVNDGKLYKFGSDNQLHEIALTKLRDDIGILPCKVRMAAPLGTPTTGYPTAHNYTIWWSQTNKAFFAAVNYDQAVNGDAIENCNYYPLSVCDEYTDYCTLSGGTQTATPRTDRIYRSGNDLWQYDKAAGKMVKLGDVTGKDLAIGYLECGDASLQGDVEVAGYLKVGNGLTVQNGLIVDKGNITCPTGDIQGYGVRGNLAKFGEADEVQIDVDGNISTTGKVSGIVVHGDSATFCQADEVKIDINGNISTTGKVSGIVVHGDSATFCQADEVKIDINGNISTEGALTVSKGIEADSIVSRGGLTVGTSLAAPSGEISGDLLVGTLSVDSDITAENITANGNITAGNLTASTATLSDTTLSGDTTFDGGSVSVDSGSLAVASGVGFYADNINAVRIDGRIDFIFHGIRQSLPTDYTAVAQAVPPKTRLEGSTYDIIYIRDKKRFVAVDDTAKTYAERFYDEEEYNIITNNKPTTARTDRTWRWNADTYKYDTEAYISAYYGKGNDKYGADLVCVTDAGKALFVKMWRDAIYRPMVGRTSWYGDCDDLGNCYGGKNNPQFGLDYGGYYPEWHETPGFFLNGITGISYAEARQIYDVRTCGPYPRKISDGGGIRTNMLCCYSYVAGGGQNEQGINTPFVFQSYDVQVIRVAAGLRGQRPTGMAWIRGALSFYNADSLVEVIGAVQVSNLGDYAFNSIFPPFGSKLQYLWIADLSVSLTKTFAKASSINVDCLRYLVEKSRATAAKPISVTLHADVFAALPEDILTLAETKYVTFVSA